MRARRYRVFGRVQGVSFRYYTLRKANELGLTGFVRNLADGSVETLAFGSLEAVEAFRAFLDRGSPMARVDRVEEESFDSGEVPESFEIQH